MKKTVAIHIKGFPFTIEEEAYQRLENYIKRLEAVLKGEEGADDIVEDIELRIAELLSKKLTGSKSIIELSDVEDVLNTLGDPSDYATEEGAEKETTSNYKADYDNTSYERRLFRDTESSYIGGVCSGLSNYFGIDVTLIRLVWAIAILLGGVGLFLYIVLWIIIPKATSSIDRLKMKGQPINVDTVKEEVDRAAKNISEKSRRFANSIKNNKNIHNVGSSIKRLFSLCFGFIFTAIGISLLIAFIGLVIGRPQMIPSSTDAGFLSITSLANLVVANPADVQLSWISFYVFAISITLFFLIGGFVMLFNINNKWYRYVNFVLITLSVIGFTLGMVVFSRTGRDFAINGELEKEIATVNTNQLVVLPVTSSATTSSNYKIKSSNMWDVYIGKESISVSDVSIKYKPSNDSLFHVMIEKEANASTLNNAIKKAENIRYNAEMKGDSLYLPATYSFPKSDKFRNQDVDVIIYIPWGKTVKIGNSIIDLSKQTTVFEDDDDWDQQGEISQDGTYYHFD